MPWLDIGDLPPTYNFNRTAPHQTFVTPEHNPPDQFFVNYSEWLDGYIVNLDKVFECLSSVRKRQIRPVLNETLDRATQLVMPTKGRIS